MKRKLPREQSVFYEDYVLHPKGKTDPNREHTLSKVKSIIDNFMKKYYKGTISSEFFMRYHDDFCKHNQDFVNAVFKDQATELGATAVSMVGGPVAVASGFVKKASDEREADSLGKFFHYNLGRLKSELSSELRGWNFKLSAAGNNLTIEMKEKTR